MSLRRLHASSAILLMAFAALHITNHLVGLTGVAAHLAFMKAARHVYRYPLVEAALLACIAIQVVSGLTFVIRGWKQRRGLIPWLQAISGTYLAFFLLVHVGAVLFGRGVLGLDTNLYFAAAGLHVPPYVLFFGPYYFLAVASLFTHLSCAAYWRVQHRPALVRRLVAVVAPLFGLVAAALIVMALAGALFPVDIPDRYLATYGANQP